MTEVMGLKMHGFEVTCNNMNPLPNFTNIYRFVER